MKKLCLAVCLSAALIFSLPVWFAAASTTLAPAGEEQKSPFSDSAEVSGHATGWEVLYRLKKEINPDPPLSITLEERLKIHSNVDSLTGDMSDPASLIGGMAMAVSFDSITRGGGTVPKVYPFLVSSNEYNDYEGTRKTAMFAWTKRLSRTLGFPVVVQRQADKYVYAEFGDPDAPEMVMAFSHLDSPEDSASAVQLARWRGPDGKTGKASVYYPNQYKTPYIKDGWLYGAGVQDDSGPTISTLFAAKALMDAGLPLDRRIRIVMGGYEELNPGMPTVTDTSKFMNIPYYTDNPSFYDNWAYKMLNREEIPIAAFTADSNFPVAVGRSVRSEFTVSMSLAKDAGKGTFNLLAGSFTVTERLGDDTLKDIIYGSAAQIASRAMFTISTNGVSLMSRDKFRDDLAAAAAAKGWDINVSVTSDRLILTVNTNAAMEYTTPQYGSNAIVRGMALLSEALDSAGVKPSDLELKKAADGITDLFFRNGVEDYIGTYMGIPAYILRNTDNGCPNMTFAFGAVGGNAGKKRAVLNFYNPRTGNLGITMLLRSTHTDGAKYTAASNALTKAWQDKGFTIGANSSFRNPALYLSHNNPLTALQLASYKTSVNSCPETFGDLYALLDISYPQGTGGGTLAANFFNKMTAFGAIFPGNERWMHAPNERISIKSAVQMTKVFADGLLEMARYSGPAGAKFMWADIPGLNPDRADPDLLDVTIGTYKDASAVILPEHIIKTSGSGTILLAATSFDIPMFRRRGSVPLSHLQIQAGHNPNHHGIRAGTQIYLDPADISPSEIFVLPMRLEFKIRKPNGVSDALWSSILAGDIESIAPLLSFNILNGGQVIPLIIPAGERADMFHYKRVSRYDPNTLYVSVNVAIKDDANTDVETIIADSKTDLYSLSPSYKGTDPFPERSHKEKRGFFVFGDGRKDARFTSPGVIFVTLSQTSQIKSGIAP